MDKKLFIFIDISTVLLQSLLCLPQSARSDYDHLIAYPNLVFEQLLMNMKVSDFLINGTFQISVELDRI